MLGHTQVIDMSEVVLITGGARSGKSRHALEMAGRRERGRVYIATAEPFDDDMRSRIREHRLERGGSFETVEAPLDLTGALGSIPGNTEVAVVDCLTVWLGNLVHHRGEDEDSFPEVNAFLKTLDRPPCDLVLVTNEVGMGVIPESRLARRFRDSLGRLNQEVARRADRVVLMASGLPIAIKGEER